MDQNEFQTEHDANVAVMERILKEMPPEKWRRIAAVQMVRAMYLEKDVEMLEKEAGDLRATIALVKELVRQSDMVRLAELENQNRQTVRQLIALVPEMQRKSRSKNSKKAAEQLHAASDKAVAKGEIEAEWQKRRQVQPKGRWFSEFAREMQRLYPEIEDPKTIQTWITDWEADFNKKVYPSCMQDG